MGTDTEALNLFARRMSWTSDWVGSVEVAFMPVLYALCCLDGAYCTVANGRVYGGDQVLRGAVDHECQSVIYVIVPTSCGNLWKRTMKKRGQTTKFLPRSAETMIATLKSEILAVYLACVLNRAVSLT